MVNITVLIANYNYGHYITDAVNSAIKQTLKPKCIVIVDDCSTDDSKSKILAFFKNPQQHHQNGLIIIQDNIDDITLLFVQTPKTSGPSFARNLAIDITHNFTDLYQILDADDVMYPEKLERLSSLMTDSVAVSYADYDIFNVHSGNLIREFKEPYSYRRLREDCIVHSGAMISKKALLECKDRFGYYDVNLRCAEDYDLWLRLAEKYIMRHIPEPLTLVRIHKENSTFSVDKTVWQQCWNRVAQKLQMRNDNN